MSNPPLLTSLLGLPLFLSFPSRLASCATKKMDADKVGAHAGSDSEIQKQLGDHVEELRKEQTRFEIDPSIDRKLNRKFDLHVIPFLFGIWYGP